NPLGRVMAQKHIQAYHQLTRRLGPIVDDVKRAFFNLDRIELKDLLSRYGEDYGDSARHYAEETYQRWKSGRVELSGQTAERLLNLVPRYLSFEQRFSMVEKLCDYHALQRQAFVSVDMKNPSSGLMEIRKQID